MGSQFQNRERQRPRFAPDVAKARQTERSRRNAEARRRAWVVLSDRHPEEFAALLASEREALEEERGPLPGDPGYEG